MAAATEDPGGVLGDPAIYTTEALRWAHSAFFSRRFTSKVAGIPDCPEGCLVPVLDVLNHRSGARAAWDVFEDRLEMRLEEPVGKGQEVFNNYGEKGNEELLMNFGFVVENNPSDVMRIKLAVPPGCSPVQDSLFRKWQLDEDHTYTLHPNALPPKLLLALGVFSASREEEAFLQGVGDEVDVAVLGPWLGLEALRVLRRNLRTRLQALSVSPMGSDSANWRNIRIYQEGQRHILEANLQFILEGYRELRQDALGWLQAQLVAADHTTPEEHRGVPWMVPASGFQADRSVAAGEPVLSLLPDHIITADRLRQLHPQFAACLGCVEGLDEEVVLQLWLLSTLCDLQQDDLAIPDPLYIWAEEDLRALGAPEAMAAAVERRQELADLHQQLFPALSRAFPRLFKRKRTGLLRAFLRAAALLDAYSMTLPCAAAPVTALVRHPSVPGALLRLPHCPLPNAMLGWDGPTASLTVEALCALEVAEHVTISYGFLDNAALLMRFGGFLSVNPCETVPVVAEADGEPATLLARWSFREGITRSACRWDGPPAARGSPPRTEAPDAAASTSTTSAVSLQRAATAAALSREREHIAHTAALM
eukprot:GGOE01014807.1.p1 GENE.GGOE01014807.1~~GGOE01014807.1.p1  ORF type:complete len:666 (+),score=188.57 GGOE01014807.1:220-1998(+)